MEQVSTPEEPTFADAVASLVSELPVPIQEFLRSPERDGIAIKLAKKYGLHVDQAGIFQLAYLHMLIGVASPEEFSKTLTDSGISKETVSSLINDVNEEVFKPLREKERQGSEKVLSTPSPAVPQTPPTPQPVKSPAPVSTAPTPTVVAQTTPLVPAPYAGARPQPLTPFNLPGTTAERDDLFRSSTRSVSPIHKPVLPSLTQPIQPHPRGPINRIGVPPVVVAPTAVETLVPPHPVQPIAPPVSKPPVVADLPMSVPPAPAPIEHQKTSSREPVTLGGTLRTMATDMLAVNEHREPEPVIYKGASYMPPILTPRPPAPQPVAIPPIDIVEKKPEPAASETHIPEKKMMPQTQPSTLITAYSTDPYRESV